MAVIERVITRNGVPKQVAQRVCDICGKEIRDIGQAVYGTFDVWGKLKIDGEACSKCAYRLRVVGAFRDKRRPD